VINDFVDEYLGGRTPNPCVRCNTHIKWEALLKRADMLGCDYIATGHYAKVKEEKGRFVVSKGLDEKKDQSYVLWGVSQECLSRTIFPIGGFEKSMIRQMASDAGFPELANKAESYEICFIPDNDYRRFLKKRSPELEDQLSGGKFIDKEGRILGEHRGYPFYTIGQRKGLELAVGHPMYVTKINPKDNTVILGPEEELERQDMWVRDVNLIKYSSLQGETEALTKIRYKDTGKLSTITQHGDRMHVSFYGNVKAIAPGQSAVFYEGDDVIGGGFIEK
jgi:tRNA-specific 2-thiouridylase